MVLVDFERAMQNPAAHFDRPADIVTEPGLSDEQRIKLLRQWEYDAMQLEVATEENMPAASQDKNWLRDVHEALQTLGETHSDHPGGTKYG